MDMQCHEKKSDFRRAKSSPQLSAAGIRKEDERKSRIEMKIASQHSMSQQTNLWKTDQSSQANNRVEISTSRFENRVATKQFENNFAVETEVAHHSETRFSLALNVVVHALGSKENVVPMLEVAKCLRSQGHRVRFATHLTFRNLTHDHDLEFYKISNAPTQLVEFLADLPAHVICGRPHRSEEKREIKKMLEGCWKSCYEVGDGTGLHHIPSDPWNKIQDYYRKPFVANAIVSNCEMLNSLSCAEALGIPLGMVHTYPLWPTPAFPHPLTIVRSNEENRAEMNMISYEIMSTFWWMEFGKTLNEFRRKWLGLRPLNEDQALKSLQRCDIAHSCLWSSALLPKQAEWPQKVNVSGFAMTELNSYCPPKDLKDFLAAGSAPIFITFGNPAPIDKSNILRMAIEAICLSGQRAVIEEGCASFVEHIEMPDSVYFLIPCHHNWLLQCVKCVIHIGEVNETGEGLRAGRPTIVVPLTGAQFFWGELVHSKGVGPKPIPLRNMTAKRLARAIDYAIKPPIIERAAAIGNYIRAEAGASGAVKHFHDQLDVKSMRCSICPSRPATWYFRGLKISLCNFAAAVLVYAGLVKPRDILQYRPKQYHIFRSRKFEISKSSTKGILRPGRLATLSASYSSKPSFKDAIAKYLANAKQTRRKAAWAKYSHRCKRLARKCMRWVSEQSEAVSAKGSHSIHRMGKKVGNISRETFWGSIHLNFQRGYRKKRKVIAKKVSCDFTRMRNRLFQKFLQTKGDFIQATTTMIKKSASVPCLTTEKLIVRSRQTKRPSISTATAKEALLSQMGVGIYEMCNASNEEKNSVISIWKNLQGF